MLKNDNESSIDYFTKFYGVRHATADYRPKLTVEYYGRPSGATTVKATPQYIKPGEQVTIEWTGITSSDLDYIQYSVVEYDEKNDEKIATILPYSESTKIGTLASGKSTISLDVSVAEGAYKTYKVYVRGVSKTGILGDENGVIINVDHAVPTGSIKVLATGTGEEVTTLKDTVIQTEKPSPLHMPKMKIRSLL